MEQLMHYTKIESLEKILETQSFRFSRATQLNDPNEGKNTEGFKTEYMLYSSSWCDDSSEECKKYMWKKYGDNNRGIRIVAPKHIFQMYIYNADNFKTKKIYLPTKYHKEFVPNIFDKFLCKMKYTEEIGKIIPNIKYYDKNYEVYKIQELSKYKEKKWQIENEWRYGIAIFHRGLIKVPKELLNIAMNKVYPEYIDLKFKKSVYKKLEIQLGKDILEMDKFKVFELQKKYKFKIID